MSRSDHAGQNPAGAMLGNQSSIGECRGEAGVVRRKPHVADHGDHEPQSRAWAIDGRDDRLAQGHAVE